MGLLDELEQIDKTKDQSEVVELLKEIIKNQKKILKLLNKVSSDLEHQKIKGTKKR